MKLELKHLAPYLPYNLMCEVKDQGKTKHAKLSGAYIDNSYAFFDTVESEHGYDSIKPILRPLSDMNKQFIYKIENNEPIYVVCLNELKKISDNIKWINLDNYKGLDGLYIKTDDYTQEYGFDRMLEIMQTLFKWHFDVFGLIPEGLAIDINTLK